MEKIKLTLELTVDVEGWNEALSNCDEAIKDDVGVKPLLPGAELDVVRHMAKVLENSFDPNTLQTRLYEGVTGLTKLGEFPMVSVKSWKID